MGAGGARIRAVVTKELPSIIVVGTTPLLGVGTPLEKVPANVQTIRGRDIEQQHSPTISDFLSNNTVSVTTNDAQGNSSQTDIDYRGFTASPLLGTHAGAVGVSRRRARE